MFRHEIKTLSILIHLLQFFVIGGSTYSQNQELVFTRQSQVDSCRIITMNKGAIRSLKVIGNDIVFLDSIRSIETITSSLLIKNTSVVSLAGFENLEKSNFISLDSNLLLTNIDHFNNLQICTFFTIKDCPLITNYDVMPMHNGEELHLIFKGNTRSIKEVKGFSKASVISLRVTDNIGIEKITGGENFKLSLLTLERNKSLKEINGLNTVYDEFCKYEFGSIPGVGIDIHRNDSLTVINAFHGLPCFKNIDISYNPLLKDINIFSKCKSFESLSVLANLSLENLTGFNEVESQLELHSGVSIIGNWNLRKVEIFNGPCRFIEFLTFGSSSYIESLTSFKQLEFIKYLDIFNTDKLKNLNNFEKLKTVEESISFLNNLSLDYCNHPAVCEFVSRTQIEYFYNNGSNCNNLQQIRQSCQTSAIDENKEMTLIHPNPVTDFLYLDFLPHNSQIYIYDLTGRILISEYIQDRNMAIDVSSLSNGIYLINVGGLFFTKFIKNEEY